MEETTMTTPLKTIVIGTSLTGASDGVVQAGISLARATGASLWLIHAYAPVGMDMAGMDALWMEGQVKGLHELMDEQVRRTGLSALPGFSRQRLQLVVGAPHREIVDLARRVHADLVVVGAAESHGILGSTADRVIRKASCPVLAIRSAAAFPPTRVEIPVDLSPLSAHAFRQSLDLLAQIGFPTAETEALFVLNPFEVGGSISFTAEQIQRFAREELGRFVAANTPEGRRPGMQVRTGYPREEILAALSEKGADLAVLGTHGRSGFERLMLGSVAAGVLRDAACNLLVIPPAVGRAADSAIGRSEEPVGADWRYVSDQVQGTGIRS
jgi:nucleotide-binding universal stress UspA family protein